MFEGLETNADEAVLLDKHLLGVIRSQHPRYANLAPQHRQLATFGPAEPFITSLMVSIYTAFLLAMPIIIYQVWAFFAPALHTSGWQMVVWGFCISTVVLYHATFTINSLTHRFGRRRYATRDDSRNNVWLALLTFGEGWHNNHHHFPGAARQGFFWWEIDLTYYGLRVLAALGIIWDLKEVPAAMLHARQIPLR